jgi:oxygen-independent coproporphyrinogen-3 oxidase
VPYVGFGIGAASFVENRRFSNDTDISAYIDNPLNLMTQEQKLTDMDSMEEFMFLGLRMTEGISYDEFKTCFGQSIESVYGNVIKKNIEDGLLIETLTAPKRLAFTDKGTDVSNYVLAQFLF